MYSNLRSLDSINKPKDLINRALDLGLGGIAITEHETLASSPEANIYGQSLLEEHPDFKVALGNEIYLIDERSLDKQKYYHFILIAKNKDGFKALRELSSFSWLNSYKTGPMERVPTLETELDAILKKYPNSLIGTSSCLGGRVSTLILEMISYQSLNDFENYQQRVKMIENYIIYNKQRFGDDFYLECAPGCSLDQIRANKYLYQLSQLYDVKLVIGTDAHYLKKEDRLYHKFYLNSRESNDREVDDFYAYSYLQDDEDIRKYLYESGFTDEIIDWMYDNSMEIWSKIENFSLKHSQQIPKVKVKHYEPRENEEVEHYPILSSMFKSEDEVERYWANECVEKLKEKELFDDTYLAQLEEEADVKRTIGEKLDTNMFRYPIVLQHYINMMWDCGSIVGVGRGSACAALNHYLLGLTQLNPVEERFPFFRYLNRERLELGDIDIDICPSKRPAILRAIKEERGKNFLPEIDPVSRANLGCTMIATFGTESTRSAILTIARGYRSEEFPEGIDVNAAQYMTSLIPSERGQLWPIQDVVYGNEEKDRRPVATFIREIKKYPGFLEAVLAIDGLVSKRSSHASGVILFDEDPYEFACFMKTPSGEVITQYDLHMDEYVGMTKYDFLVTEVCDKIVQCIDLIIKSGTVKEKTVKEFYDAYLHPDVLPINDKKYWDALYNEKILNVFQFDSLVGSQAIKKIHPENIWELTQANSLMRLMASEKGGETPMDKFVRFKNDPMLWKMEMFEAGLSLKEQEVIKPYFEPSYGVPSDQECLMWMLMDKDICGFTLAEANDARKIVGKKQMKRIPELRNKILSQAASPALGNYIWKYGIGPQMGYAFSRVHSQAYSYIGFQTVFLAKYFPSIFWNCACIIINSGSLETEDEAARDKTTDYAKISKAIAETRALGISVSLVDINTSAFGFTPDLNTNTIRYGLKGLSKVGDDVIARIIEGRPYKGIADFMSRCQVNKTVMFSLIKAGAFDELDKHWTDKIHPCPRIALMAYYLSQTCDKKSRVNLQNFNGLVQRNLLPAEFEFQKTVFSFNKFLKENCKAGGEWYRLGGNCLDFFLYNFDNDVLINEHNGFFLLPQKQWEKIYSATMDVVRDWMKANQTEVLNSLNSSLFVDEWAKYGKGTIPAWEMESLGFYYSGHELARVNESLYGVNNFSRLPREATPVNYAKGKYPIFELTRIMGTVIAKNKDKYILTLSTLDGIVDVKFSKDYFAMINRRITELDETTGKSKIMEDGWTARGTKLLVSGYRRDDTFVAKSYSKEHTVYLITDVLPNGEMAITHCRYGMEDNDD